MTLIVDVLDRAARQCSITQPDSWITATALAHVELREDFLLETIGEIQDRVENIGPVMQEQTITGAATGARALNTDFKRLLRTPNAVYETSSVRRRVVPVMNAGDWTHLLEAGVGANRYYRLSQKADTGVWLIEFEPDMVSGDTVKVSYVSTKWVGKTDDTTAATFTDTRDTVYFPRRLVEAGIVWRFRERKGLSYQGKLAQYEALLERYSNDIKGRLTISFGDHGQGYSPRAIPVPDFIPAS